MVVDGRKTHYGVVCPPPHSPAQSDPIDSDNKNKLLDSPAIVAADVA
jgi:hypothetical protein